MKTIFPLLLLTIFLTVSCLEKPKNDNPIDNSDEQIIKQEPIQEVSNSSIQNIEQKHQSAKPQREIMDVSKALNEENEDIVFYLAGYKNRTFSACCFDPLSKLFGENIKSSVKQLFPNHIESISYYHFENDSSLIHTYKGEYVEIEIIEYNDPRFGPSTSISRKSYITDNSVIFPNKVQIGMSKNEFTSLFFSDFPDSIYHNIEQFSISHSELGEDYTNYHFKNDSLIKITFDIYL